MTFEAEPTTISPSPAGGRKEGETKRRTRALLYQPRNHIAFEDNSSAISFYLTRVTLAS